MKRSILFVILSVSLSFGICFSDFEMETSLTKEKQDLIKEYVENALITSPRVNRFDGFYNKAYALDSIILNIDTFSKIWLSKEALFAISYLRYIALENLYYNIIWIFDDDLEYSTTVFQIRSSIDLFSDDPERKTHLLDMMFFSQLRIVMYYYKYYTYYEILEIEDTTKYFLETYWEWYDNYNYFLAKYSYFFAGTFKWTGSKYKYDIYIENYNKYKDVKMNRIEKLLPIHLSLDVICNDNWYCKDKIPMIKEKENDLLKNFEF